MSAQRQWPVPLTCVGSLLAVVVLLAGCGGSQGPVRYVVSGQVTYEGKPIPVGFIYFRPDVSRGGSGPACGARIEQGAYQTPVGRGSVGGPHFVEIVGRDGVGFESEEGYQADGRLLFSSYATEVDLPQEDVERDFDVPSQSE